MFHLFDSVKRKRLRKLWLKYCVAIRFYGTLISHGQCGCTLMHAIAVLVSCKDKLMNKVGNTFAIFLAGNYVNKKIIIQSVRQNYSL